MLSLVTQTFVWPYKVDRDNESFVTDSVFFFYFPPYEPAKDGNGYKNFKLALVRQLMIVIVFNLPESFMCSSAINHIDYLFQSSSPHTHKPTDCSSWCGYCSTRKVQTHFPSEANGGVSETRRGPALLIRSNTRVWPARICQEDLSYETWGIFCHAILCPFFFQFVFKLCGKWYVKSSVSWVFQTTDVATWWMLFCY